MVADKQELSGTACNIYWKVNAFSSRWRMTRYLSDCQSNLSPWAARYHIRNDTWIIGDDSEMFSGSWVTTKQIGSQVMLPIARTWHMWICSMLTGESSAHSGLLLLMGLSGEQSSGLAMQLQWYILTTLLPSATASVTHSHSFLEPTVMPHGAFASTTWLPQLGTENCSGFFFIAFGSAGSVSWISSERRQRATGLGWREPLTPGEKQEEAREAGLPLLLAPFYNQAVPFELKGVYCHGIC